MRCLAASSFLQSLEVLGCWEACWWEDSSTRWRFLDCEVPGCVQFSPVTGGIGMLVWISDLGMKKGFPEITGNPNRGAKGTPAVYWYSAVFSAFRNCGYLIGYLTWLFSPCFSGHRSRR